MEEEAKKLLDEQDPRDTKLRRCRKVGAMREKGDALVIKTEQSKYSDVLKARRNDAKLVHLGANVLATCVVLGADFFTLA